MLRATNWMVSLSIGLALAGQAVAMEAPTASQAVPAAQGEQARPVDYVVELPAEDEPDTYDGGDESAQPLEDSQPAAAAPLEEGETIKERFPNGRINVERQVTQDVHGNYINHGTWKMWDQAGNLVAQGQYENGNRTGTWVRWYRSATEAKLLSQLPYKMFAGPFISQATFVNGKLNGLWTIYDGKMRKISQWSFVEGRRHGPSVWWYPNAKKMRDAEFVNGDMDGPYGEWAPDGSLTSKETYQAGRKLALKTSHHQGGAKKSEGMYLFAKDVEHTPDDWWTCKLVATIKNGKDEKHGHWTSWFANGQKQLEGRYLNDLQDGEFTWWHANGQKQLHGSFDRGKQNGVWTWWYANGQKSIQGEYLSGNPTGRWTWWQEDGRVVQSADLSQSEGVVIETPRTLGPQAPPVPRVGNPARRQPVR